MDDFKAYFNSIPPVTRYFCGITFLLSFCITYKIISPYALFLTYDYIVKDY